MQKNEVEVIVEVLTAVEIAELLKIGKVKAYELMKSGEIKSFRVGKRNIRTTKQEFMNYIGRSEINGEG